MTLSDSQVAARYLSFDVCYINIFPPVSYPNGAKAISVAAEA